MTISAAALVAIWGDELAEVDKARLGNTKMPGRDEKVSTRDLASAIVALTVWDLWSARALHVSFDRKKRLGLNTAKVTIQATAAPAFPFAAALAGACHQPRRLEAALQDALGGEQADAASTVVNGVHGELVHAGVLVPTGDSTARSIAKAFVGASVLEAVPGATYAHRAAWEVLKSGWLQWQQANPADAQLLFKEARSAITYATASND
ncbi:MAG: hypothetical protein JWM47_2427 [Acidimicrobiales bacterium]|nr:hypothetical protein [Acidimicrobiales bacterium]